MKKCMLIMLVVGTCAQAELMTNGGFESGTEGWYLWAGNYPEASINIVNDAAGAMEGSQYIVTSGTGNFEVSKHSALSEPNTTYVMTMWVRPSADCSNTYVQIGMQGWTNIEGYYIGSSSLQKGKWNKIEISHTTGSTGMIFQPEVYVWGLSSGTLALDGISIVPVPEPATLLMGLVGMIGVFLKKRN